MIVKSYSALIAVSGIGTACWFRNRSRTNTIPTISTSRTDVICIGPVKANICPINQGKSMLPAPDPTRNQPVIAPVIIILSPASIKMVGKMEAIDKPSPMVPIHSARVGIFPQHDNDSDDCASEQVNKENGLRSGAG